MTERANRLRNIAVAQRELESAILTLKQHFKVTWTNASFKALYYLVALAKKAPTEVGRAR